jgi:hypothetical protein
MWNFSKKIIYVRSQEFPCKALFLLVNGYVENRTNTGHRSLAAFFLQLVTFELYKFPSGGWEHKDSA